MIRLTELRLPLHHPEDALRAAVLGRLGIADVALNAMHVFRRGYDARKPHAIMLVYTLDVEVADEAALLARHAGDQRISTAPDTEYRFVARAPEGIRRPVVVGTGNVTFSASSRASSRASSGMEKFSHQMDSLFSLSFLGEGRGDV